MLETFFYILDLESFLHMNLFGPDYICIEVVHNTLHSFAFNFKSCNLSSIISILCTLSVGGIAHCIFVD